MAHHKSGLMGTALRTLAVTGIAAAATKFLKKRQADSRAAERQEFSRLASTRRTVASH
ncbi:hypothetical protein ACWDYH_39510 [Nocardia goodfellowii]|uniref:Uncharacterized protein n=1 Tax=Nocardia goodfellowii TaxID=882446 RepID=A0ABS4QKU1_9NOCA|nr:hypothetical protein [Nocardia goodfellowii]MBP2192312.1 hypothetical protein [Nocardia goodfellowii]